jgi:hypothetical protein
MNVFDILLDENFDLKFENGDIQIGESTRQHQQLIILTEKGSNRQYPTRGVGITNFINDDLVGGLNSVIKRELELDGMIVKAVQGIGDNLIIEAEYADNS